MLLFVIHATLTTITLCLVLPAYFLLVPQDVWLVRAQQFAQPVITQIITTLLTQSANSVVKMKAFFGI